MRNIRTKQVMQPRNSVVSLAWGPGAMVSVCNPYCRRNLSPLGMVACYPAKPCFCLETVV